MTNEQKPEGYFYANGTGGSSAFRSDQITVDPDGTALVRGIKIFRSGTFRDSRGRQHTWEPSHLGEMVTHFEHLRTSGVFRDVPIRRDHSGSIDKVMGYFEGVRHEEPFLVADYRITEPTDVDKFIRGTYRNFSSEIGAYVTNNEEAYWPVLMGVAAVDIPAVEGLYGKNVEGQTTFFSQITPQGDDVSTSNQSTSNNGTPPPDAGASRPEPVKFQINGAETTDFAAVQAHIIKLEADNQSLATDRDALVEFQREAVQGARVDYVKSLAADHKIAAPQEGPMTELVKEMSDEMYEAFKATYAAAPKMDLLAKHGDGTSNLDGQPDPLEDEKSILTETVATHRRMGLSEDQIANTKAAKRLAELNKS